MRRHSVTARSHERRLSPPALPSPALRSKQRALAGPPLRDRGDPTPILRLWPLRGPALRVFRALGLAQRLAVQLGEGLQPPLRLADAGAEFVALFVEHLRRRGRRAVAGWPQVVRARAALASLAAASSLLPPVLVRA